MEEGTLLCNEDILGGHGSAGLLAPRGGGVSGRILASETQ